MNKRVNELEGGVSALLFLTLGEAYCISASEKNVNATAEIACLKLYF